MTFQPGERFGRYELVSRLGRGGMAETWKARLVGEAGVTKPVLIKKVLPEFANNQTFTSMFISEARISASLSHGNIAHVYDFGRADGEYFLAMEYVDGQPLQRITKRALRAGLPSIPVPLATFIALEICRGLYYAHTRRDENGIPLSIVHRDISPDNVLISYEGQVKIVDFGIAKAREMRGFNTEPGVVKGKFLFFSPEQARGEEVDARTDVWATGVVLYEMICGQLPIGGPQYVALSQIVHGEFPNPRQLRPEIPDELNTIVMRALAVDREKRFVSCYAFEDALAGFLNSVAPRFSAITLAHFVQELFRQDLHDEGKDVQVPQSFLEQLALWRGDSLRTVPLIPVVPQAPPTQKSGETSLPSVSSPPPKSHRSVLLWGVGAGMGLSFLILGIALAAFKFRLQQPVTNEILSPQSAVAEGEHWKGRDATSGEHSVRAPPVAAPPSAAAPPQERSAPPLPPIRGNMQPQIPLAAASVAHASQDESPAQDPPAVAKLSQPSNAIQEAPSRVESTVNDSMDSQGETPSRNPLPSKKPSRPPPNTAEGEPSSTGSIAQTPPASQEVIKPISSVPSEKPPSEEPIRPLGNALTLTSADALRLEAANAFKEKRFLEAADLSGKCIQLTPKNADCYLLSGDAHAAMNQGAKAVEQYRTFLHIAKGHKAYDQITQHLRIWEARLTLDEALKLHNEKKYDQALALTKRCLKLEDSNAECHLVAASAHGYLGYTEKAVEHYRIFLNLAPAHKHAPAIRQKLELYDKKKSMTAQPR